MNNHANVLHQLESLAEGFSHLSAQLSQAAKDLQDSGLPPPESLIEQQVATRREFMDLQARVEALELA